jgi:creatinine amidohydrolase/Fe(II)-dependent formamide hydrolase-like protein
MKILYTVALLAIMPVVALPKGPARPKPAGVLLEELTWVEAEKALTPETVVVIPLGAQAKEHGFYVLNTGVSTRHALGPAAAALAAEGIEMRYTDLLKVLGPTEAAVCKQEGGTHADEGETSMMLVIDPASVDMRKAVKDYHPGEGGLTRDPKGKGAYSASGVYGDATLATRAKGERLVAAVVEGVLADIEALRRAPNP